MTRALSIELQEVRPEMCEKEALFDEIIQNLPAENSTLNFLTNFSQDTLQDEFDQLVRMNLQ